jgi:hypothetical protein
MPSLCVNRVVLTRSVAAGMTPSSPDQDRRDLQSARRRAEGDPEGVSLASRSGIRHRESMCERPLLRRLERGDVDRGLRSGATVAETGMGWKREAKSARSSGNDDLHLGR